VNILSAGGVNIAYNKSKFPGGSHPKTWAEFWDVKKFPGPRGLPNWGSPDQVIAFALVADGVPMDKVLPFDYDRAFKKLDQIKPHVTVWWTSGSQFQQTLRDEEVLLSVGWDGRIIALEKQGLPIGIEWNQGYYYCSSWGVTKGTKKKDLAMKFLNSTLDPQRQAVMTKELGYAPTNIKTFDYLDPEEKTKRASYPPILSKMFKMDPEFVAKNQKEINQKWEGWLLRK
jgi:spermidine/putrescine-binding protein